MEKQFTLSLSQMHPGVAEMTAIYHFYCEYNGKRYDNNADDTMFMLATDNDEVTVNGLDVFVPYHIRQAKQTVKITATLNDYVHKITGTDEYQLSFSTTFSEERTFFDDFDTLDEMVWSSGEYGWEYGDLPGGVVENSDLVFRATEQARTLMVTTAHSFSQARGCFSARMKMPERKSTNCNCNCAFWLCSNVKTPEKIMFKRNPHVSEPFGRAHAGEIDITEYSGSFGDFAACSYHHFGWGQYSIHSGLCAPTPGVREGYHIFSLVWEKEALYWYYDEELIRVYDSEGMQGVGYEPGAEMVILLELGYSYPGQNFPGTWTGMSDPRDLPYELRFDWVRVHALNE